MALPLFTVQELELPGVLLITPLVRSDNRGFSVNVYNAEAFAQHGISTRFAEDFTSYSKKGVLRGFHFQRPPHEQDKLVRCSRGTVLDVAADHAPDSPTYGKSVSVELSDVTQEMLFIPGRYAHAFYVLSDSAQLEYKLSDTYHPESVGGVRYDDAVLAITWPEEPLLISDQDRAWPSLQAM